MLLQMHYLSKCRTIVRNGFQITRHLSHTPTMDPPSPSLSKPMHVPQKLLMGPGPSNGSARVLAAGALPLLGHLHPEFTQIMDTIQDGIRYLFQTKTKYALAVSGTGHTAMESAVTNLVEAGDTVLVAANGLWGDRFADMAERHDGNVKKIMKMPGDVFSIIEVQAALEKFRPQVMFVTHGESSGGTCQPLQGIGKLCQWHNCILVVDSVAAAGGVPLYMDDWNIDYLYSGGQKVLGAPPGASPVAFNERAWRRIQNRKRPVRSFCLDMNFLTNYWGCNGEPRKYHHTAPISSFYQLREAFSQLAEEGLQASWDRHQECALHLQEGLADLGIEMVVPNPEHRLPCVNTIFAPRGMDPMIVIKHAMQNYNVEISGGLGSLAGKIWRVGLMGNNATIENVDLVLKIIKEGLNLHQKTIQSSL